jgi:hypothetical protein
MLIFPPNQFNFIARILFFILTLVLIYMFVSIGVKEPDMQDEIFRISVIGLYFKVLYLMYFLITMVVFLAVTIGASLLGVYRIEVDKDDGRIIFTRLLKKTTIQSNQILNYFQTSHRNGIKNWYGAIIQLNDQTKIQLAGQNINNMPAFEKYLATLNVVCAGKGTMRFPFS